MSQNILAIWIAGRAIFDCSFSDVCVCAFLGICLIESRVFSRKLYLFSVVVPHFGFDCLLQSWGRSAVKILSLLPPPPLLFSSACITQTGRLHETAKLYSTGMLKQSNSFVFFFICVCLLFIFMYFCMGVHEYTVCMHTFSRVCHLSYACQDTYTDFYLDDHAKICQVSQKIRDSESFWECFCLVLLSKFWIFQAQASNTSRVHINNAK